MYIATQYIGTDWTPGEILPDGLPEEFIRRLLKQGAVKEAAPVSSPGKPKTEPETEPEAEVGARPDEAEAPEIDVTEAEDAEAENTEPDAPEIDVTEAIVSGAEDAEKPANRKAKARGGRGK